MVHFLKFFVPLLVMFIAGPAFAEICDGKYSNAGALVDRTYSRYGTLYSGGQGYDGIGGTLDVYRMLSGLPDAGFSTLGGAGANAEYVDDHIYLPDESDGPEEWKMHFEQVVATLKRNLSRLLNPEFRRNTEETKTDIEIIFDHYSTLGPYLGWWIGPPGAQLSDLERTIASLRDEDGMDWIHTVLAASANGVKTSWGSRYRYYTLEGRGYQNLFNHSVRQFAAKDSLPWFVAAHLTMDRYVGGRYDVIQPKDIDPEILFKTYLSLMYAVKTCTASEGEYVAYAIALFERTRLGMAEPEVGMAEPEVGLNEPEVGLNEPEVYEQITGYPLRIFAQELAVMPGVLRNMAAVSIAQKMANLPPWRKKYEVSAKNLQKLATTPSFKSWLNVFRSYQTRSVDELIELNEGVRLNPKTVRMLNLLSVDDLVRFTKSRVGFPTERRMINTAIFLRMFALGRDDEALAMAPTLAQYWPETENEILAIWEGAETVGYRLAKIIKHLPTQTTLIVPTGIKKFRSAPRGSMFDVNLQSDFGLIEWYAFRRSWDMPMNIRSGAFIERDVKKWMGASGASPYAAESSAQRASRRGITTRLGYPETSSRRYLNVEYSRKLKQGIISYAAFEEHKKISPDSGLANRVARELILHGRRKSNPASKPLQLNENLVAEELRYVVHLGKRTTAGKMEGKPVSEVAYDLLHERFAKTEAAKKTRYWYVCKERCAH